MMRRQFILEAAFTLLCGAATIGMAKPERGKPNKRRCPLLKCSMLTTGPPI